MLKKLNYLLILYHKLNKRTLDRKKKKAKLIHKYL